MKSKSSALRAKVLPQGKVKLDQKLNLAVGINEAKCREYCCRYFHDGKWWALDITAYDAADAEARVAKLGNLQLLGELKMKIPAVRGAGLFTRLLCSVRNAFKGAKS